MLVRPSYVLSGAAMNVCSNQRRVGTLSATGGQRIEEASGSGQPVHRTCQGGGEMDAVAQDGEIIAYAISEHIEFAGSTFR